MNNAIKNSWQGASALLFTLLFILSCASVHAAPPTEHEVEVAFIHNIAKFVEWPVAHRAGDNLRLCILGQSLFTKAAGPLAGRRVGELVWEVSPVYSRANLQECRVLFIAASESDNLSSILEGIGGSAVLTVGDSGGYAERGVMVNFYSEEKKVRFEINVDAVRRNGLKVSSHLLKLARIVHESGRMQ